MTPQEKIKARLKELLGESEGMVAVRNRQGAYYVTLGGDYNASVKVLGRLFPEAYLTSGGAFDQTFRVIPDSAIAAVLDEMEIDPGWLVWNDATVVRIAQGIHDDRAFERLPVLADALEEAGCTNAALLNHCRTAKRHGRSCWAVDLLLQTGKKPRRSGGK